MIRRIFIISIVCLNLLGFGYSKETCVEKCPLKKLTCPPKKENEALLSLGVKPTLKFRAKMEGFSIPLNDGVKQRLRNKLKKLSEEKFNAIVWMGACEVWPPAGQKLIRHEKFPEARELSEEQIEKNIADMKWMLGLAKEYGLDNHLYTLSVLYTPAFGKAHGFDKEMPVSETVSISHNLGWPVVGADKNLGLRNKETIEYTQSVYEELTRTYKDLDGYYAPMGEPLPGKRSSWFKEAIAPGLKRSGRKPLAMVHQWEVPLEEFIEDIAPKEVYDNTWLAFHAYNSEQITDAKPYPSVVRWAEETEIPTVVAVYPANMKLFPFNSPKFAYEMAVEMKRTRNLVGWMFWDHSRTGLTYLFGNSLAYYSSNTEKYSEEPWLDILEARFGNRIAAKHFLKAFDISARIIPELCALAYIGSDYYPRELWLTYSFFTGEYNGSWLVDPLRPWLVPVREYARRVAQNPQKYKNYNGSDLKRNEPRQMSLWYSQGGSEYETIPPVHMKQINDRAESALAEAEKALAASTKNLEEAQLMTDFMKAYQMMARYYEAKVTAATAALVYAQARRPEDKAEAEKFADKSVRLYQNAVNFMKTKLEKPLKKQRNITFNQLGTTLDELLAQEKDERKRLAEIFNW